jgi:hypothetical protein
MIASCTFAIAQGGYRTCADEDHEGGMTVCRCFDDASPFEGLQAGRAAVDFAGKAFVCEVH